MVFFVGFLYVFLATQNGSFVDNILIRAHLSN